MNDLMDNFIEMLGGAENIEICDLKRVLPGSYQEVLKRYRHLDLYIIGGKDPKVKKRCGNKDITSKSYFIFDIDIRDNYKKIYGGENLTEDGLEDKIKELVDLLGLDPYLSEWSYIVHSGNGVHIYYSGEALIVGKNISIESYSRGVKKIYDLYIEYLKDKEKELEKDFSYLYPDYMCANIGRTTRLPQSYNRKKKDGFPDMLVKIYKFQACNSTLFQKIPLLGIEISKPPYKKSKGKQKTEKYKKIDVNNFKISEVIKKYTGKTYEKGTSRCPFPGHDDKEPSFSVNIKENYFNCFAGCGGGNPANFIAKFENMNYGEAIRKLDKNF